MCDKAVRKFPWTFKKDTLCQTLFCEMAFLLDIPDGNFKIKLQEFTEFCGGKVYSSINEMNPYTAVLTVGKKFQQLGFKCCYNGDVFYYKYIEDCYNARARLDITLYRVNKKSRINIFNFNYMDIIFFKKYTFDSVPQEYLSSDYSTNNIKGKNSNQDKYKTNESPVKNSTINTEEDKTIKRGRDPESLKRKASNHTINNEEEKNIEVQPNIGIESQNNKKIALENCICKTRTVIDSNSQHCAQEVTEIGPNTSQFMIKFGKQDNQCSEKLDTNEGKNDRQSKVFNPNRKNTRMPYSRREKEAILKYIVENELEANIKGNIIWKQMEKDKVCEIRTWQSMREHFLKSMISELSLFGFLTPKQRKDLKFYYSCNKMH